MYFSIREYIRINGLPQEPRVSRSRVWSLVDEFVVKLFLPRTVSRRAVA